MGTEKSPKNNFGTKKEVATSEGEVVRVEPEILENLPKDIRDELLSLGRPEAKKIVHSIVLASKKYSGPLPLAEEFAQYEETLPGAADRILSCMENEQKHRQQVTDKMSTVEADVIKRGQILGFCLMLLLVIGGILCIFYQLQILGVAFLAAPVCNVAKKFLPYNQDRDDD